MPAVLVVRCRRCAALLRLPLADPRCPRARDALDRALAGLGWRGSTCPACRAAGRGDAESPPA